MIEYVKGDAFFTKTNDANKQYPYLTEDLKTDVAIIGGGVTGAIVSYYFSKNCIPNLVLEKGRIAHSSTSITTSLLQYELDGNCAELSKFIDEKSVIRAYKAGLHALDEIKNFAEQYGNNFEYKVSDSVLFSNKKLDENSIKEEFEIRKKHGLPVELFDESSNPFGFDIKYGIVAKNAAAKIDPFKFTHTLLDISTQKYSSVFENSEVISVEYLEDCVLLTTVYGYKIKAKKIIVATGYNIDLFTNVDLGVKMSTTFNIATSPIPNLDSVYDNNVFRDNDNIYHYFRTTKDKRILFGGEDIGFINDIDNKTLCEKQYDTLEKMCKQFFKNYEFDIDYKYCGAFASTHDNLGFVGQDAKRKNQWYCLGYGANGILFAILGGMILSDLYLGKNNEYSDLFDCNRFLK